MKKSIVIIILIITNFAGNCQSTILPTELINYPLSPESASFSVYGNNNINLSTGQLNFDIAIHNIKTNELSVPINIYYSNNGLKVDESKTTLGAGWFLNYGGSITREVRGLPDEALKGILNVDLSFKNNILYPYFENQTLPNYTDCKAISNGEYDTERDKYNVNFNGIKFSFIIADNGLPFSTTAHNNKITLSYGIANPKSVEKITITDENGIIYEFATVERLGPLGRFDQVFNDSFQSYINTWNITTIKLTNNDNIAFDYIDDIIQIKSYYATAIQRQGSVNSTYSEGFSLDFVRRKLLKNINYRYGKIQINYSNGIGIDKIMESIKVLDPNNTVVDNFEFFYNHNKIFLEKVKRNNTNYYLFDYYNKDQHFGYNNENKFTQGVYKSKDFWGYYNGSGSPCMIKVPFANCITTNKAPNLITTRIGALQKITYPTKGSTELFYELNTVAVNPEADAGNVSPNTKLNLNFKTDNIYGAATKEAIYKLTFTDPTYVKLKHSLKSYDNAHIAIEIYGTANGQLLAASTNYYIQEQMAVNNLLGATPQFNMWLNDILDDNHQAGYPFIKAHSSQGVFKIPAGEYTFRVFSIENYKNAEANIELEFYKNYNSNTNMINKSVGGLRISKTIDNISEINKTENYFVYDNFDNVSTGQLLGLDSNVTNISQVTEYGSATVENGTCTSAFEYNETTYSDKSVNAMHRNANVFYKSVIKHQGIETTLKPRSHMYNILNAQNIIGNWQIGAALSTNEPIIDKTRCFIGLSKTDFFLPETSAMPNFQPNIDYNEGMVENTEIIVKPEFSSNYQTVEQTNVRKFTFQHNNYSDKYNQQIAQVGNLNHLKSLKIFKKAYRIFNCILGHNIRPNVMQDFRFITSFDRDNFSLPTQESKKTYIVNGVISNVSNFDYDLSYRLKNTQILDSRGQIVKQTNFYADDLVDPNFSAMTLQNQSGKIVKVDKYLNGNLLFSEGFKYQNLSPTMFKPIKFFAGKSSGLFEDKIQYGYDDIGNVVETFKIANAPHLGMNSKTILIYGYNQTLPIAKLENLNYGSLAPYITNLQNISNTANSEVALLAALQTLRTDFPNAMITTYTHKPLIGVSTVTDPKGDIIRYFYDTMNRLDYVLDKNGNKLSENQYNYKP